MKALAAALALTLCSCSTVAGPGELGALVFVGNRTAAGIELPLGRVKVGIAVTLVRATVAPDADEGELPWSDK